MGRMSQDNAFGPLILWQMDRGEFAPVELKCGVAVGLQIRHIVPAGIQVKLVGDFQMVKLAMQFAGSPIEPVGVFGAAIEVDLRIS